MLPKRRVPTQIVLERKSLVGTKFVCKGVSVKSVYEITNLNEDSQRLIVSWDNKKNYKKSTTDYSIANALSYFLEEQIWIPLNRII